MKRRYDSGWQGFFDIFEEFFEIPYAIDRLEDEYYMRKRPQCMRGSNKNEAPIRFNFARFFDIIEEFFEISCAIDRVGDNAI